MAIYFQHYDNLSLKEIRIDAGSTDDAIRIVQLLMDQKKFDPNKLSIASLHYEVGHTPDPDPTKTSHYPLNFYGGGLEIYVNNVAAGFDGTASRGTMTLLNMLGFKYSATQEQLITQITYDENGERNTKINLTFSKF